MPTESSKEPREPALPFVARKKEVAQLQRLHAQRQHALILGPQGIGKSALMAHLHDSLRLIRCERSSTLGEICDGLEAELGLRANGLRLIQRKQRLFKALLEAGRTVVFDGVSWTTPKMSAFLGYISERLPVWICTRSELSQDIGHFWTLLVRFARVELRPFQRADTHALVEAAVKRDMVSPDVRNIVEWLHRRSGGSPLILRELLDELAKNKYNLSHPHALRLLDLDRRIREMLLAPVESAQTPRPD